MPSAGLQIFGAGLRLQAASPGVADVGNAHVNGVIMADAGMLPSIVPPSWGPGFYDQRNIYLGASLTMTWGPSSDDVQRCIFIGQSITARGNQNGTNISSGVNIGSFQKLKEVGGTVIGGLAENGTTAADPNASNYNVVVGYAARGWSNFASINGDTVIGALAQTGSGATAPNPTNASTVVGFQCKSTGNGKNVVIGTKTTVSHVNCIFITPSTTETSTADNTIKIGDSTNTGPITIGPVVLAPKPTITGAKAGNAALADLLTKLAAMNLIVDSTT